MPREPVLIKDDPFASAVAALMDRDFGISPAHKLAVLAALLGNSIGHNAQPGHHEATLKAVMDAVRMNMVAVVAMKRGVAGHG